MRKQGEFGYGALDDSDQPFLAADSDEKQFLGLMEKASSSIQRINSNVSSIERSVRQIGTPTDSANLRNRITSVLEEVHQYVSRTQNNIKQLKELARNLNKEHRLQEERITNQFMETVQRVSAIQKKVANQMKSFPNLPKPSFNSTDVLLGLSRKTTQPEEEVGFSSGMDAQVQKQSDAAGYDLNLLEERQRQVRDIEEKIVDVNEIFRDLSTMVMEQGDMIDSIEANVERGGDNVEQAREELQKAEIYQRKARRKQVCIAITLVIVVLIIILILYLILR